jgi:hypothetical protein
LSFSLLYPAQALEAWFCPATENLQGATSMHEIPNFPPGQQEPEHSALAQLELGQPADMKTGAQSEKCQQASSED